MPDKTANETRVLYNETCPVCRYEIGHYRKAATACDLPLRFDDLSHASDWGITAEDAAKRLHVLHQGQILSGIPAFQILWAGLPRWRWVARLTALPLIHPACCAIYDHLMAPLLYRAHLRREAAKNLPQ